jgi:hypothetical protein
MRAPAAVLTLALTCALTPAAARSTLPHPCSAPPSLSSAVSSETAALAKAAQQARASLSTTIANFEAQCASVEIDSAQYQSCVALNASVDADISAYLNQLDMHKAALAGDIEEARADAPNRIALLDEQIASTRAKLAADGERVRGIEAAAKEWEDASETARVEMQETAIGALRDTVVDFALGWVKVRREREITLDEVQIANVQRNILNLWVPAGVKLPPDKLEALLVLDHRWTVHGYKFAERLTTNRSNVFWLGVIQRFNTTLDIAELTGAWTGPNEKRKDKLKTYATTLKMLVKDPQLKLLINQLDLNSSLAYLFVAESEAMARIEQLNQLSGDSLKGIEALSALHRRQVDSRAALKRLLAQPAESDTSGCPLGAVGVSHQ